MTCPKCGGDTKVVDSRKSIDHVIRYRRCIECKYRFNTIETDEDIYVRLEKGKRLKNENESNK